MAKAKVNGTNGASERPRHDVFISYSHAAEGRLAPALQSGLEQLLRRWYQLRSFAIFRDQTNLSLHPDLWSQIEQELTRANYLLLLLSPDAAHSTWVNREVEWWLRNRNKDSILLVLTSGELVWNEPEHRFDPELSTSLPPALRDTYSAEPHWLDLRWCSSESGLSHRHTRFRDALLDIAATLKGVSKDSLESEALRTLRRNQRTAAIAICALTLALTAAIVSGWRTENERILGQARLLQDTNPTESFLVLGELNERMWRTEDVIRFLPQSVLQARITRVRHGPGDSINDIAFGPGGMYAMASSDGHARVWTATDRLAADVPARWPASNDEKHGFGNDPVPLSLVGFLENAAGLATVDARGCLRIMALDRTLAAGDLSKASQDCLNREHEKYGAAAWDAAGNIAWVRGQEVHGGALKRTWVAKISRAGQVDRVAPSSHGMAAILLFADGSAALSEPSGPTQWLASDVADIGTCADGTGWMLQADGNFRQLRGNGGVVKLQGTSPWKISPRCTLYVDGAGNVYRFGGSRPVAKTIASDWQYSGNMVKVAFSNSDDQIAVSTIDGAITVHDLVTGQSVPLTGHKKRILNMQFSPDRATLMSTSFDGTVRIFDLSSGIVPQLPAPKGASSIYVAHGRLVFSGQPYVGPTLGEHEVDREQMIQPLGGTQAGAHVASDWKLGQHYVMFDDETDMAVLICKTPGCETNSILRKFSADGAERPAYARASPDGRYIVAVDASRRVRVFDLRRADDDPLFRYTAATVSGASLDAAFEADSSHLLILDHEKLLRIPLTMSKLGALVSSRIAYCLTRSERESYLFEWSWLAGLRASACERKHASAAGPAG